MKTVVMFALSVSTLVAQPQLVVASHAGAAEDCILTPTAACILVLAKPMIAGIEDAEDRAEAWRDFASAQFRARDFDGALATMNQIQIPEIRHEAQRDLVYMAGMFASRTYGNDLRIVKNLIAKALPHDDRGQALRLLVELQAKSGDLESADETQEEIESPPSRSGALVEIARARAEAGQSLDALADLAQAWEIALTIEAPVERVEVMGDIARWQAEAGQLPLARENLEHALDLALETHKPWLLGRPLEVYIRLLAKSGDIAGAVDAVGMLWEIEDWLLASRETPLGTETKYSSTAIRSIVAAQTEAGDVAGALATSEAFEDQMIDPPAVMSIVVRLLKANKVAAALDLALGLEPSWIRAECLSLISNAQAKASRTIAAAETAAEALETAAGLGNKDDRKRALEKIVSRRLQAGDVAAALEAVEAMKSRTDPASAQSKIAAKYAAEGDFPSAVALARRIDDDRERATALKIIVQKLIQADDIAGALALAGTIERDYQRGTAKRAVAYAQAKEGDLEDALATALAITDPDYRADALARVAISQSENGDHSKALETALAIEVDKDAIEALTTIAQYVAASR